MSKNILDVALELAEKKDRQPSLKGHFDAIEEKQQEYDDRIHFFSELFEDWEGD